MTATAHNFDDRATILAALDRFIRQRPGLEFGNYGDWSAYRAEVRSIGRDLQHARTLLAYVDCLQGIDADRLKAAFRGAYSGRLNLGFTRVCDACHRDPTLQHNHAPRAILDYCTGQYWPTEYRKAACAVLASAIWDYWRDHAPALREGVSVGDHLRRKAFEIFGRAIAGRWFN